MARKWMTRLTRYTVVVHLTSGASVRGVLLGVHGDCLRLTGAAYLGDGAVTMVDGEVVVPREQVAWLQTLQVEGTV